MNKENNQQTSEQKVIKTAKPKKWVYVVFPLIFLIIAAVIGVVSFFAYKSCHKEEEKPYSITITQPKSPYWTLTVNGQKENVKVAMGDSLEFVATYYESDASKKFENTNVEDACYYLQIAPTTKTEAKTYTNELHAIEIGKSYGATFPMAWDYDVTFSITTVKDYEDSFYVKDDSGKITYLYEKSTLYNTNLDYVLKINPEDLTQQVVLKSSFGAVEERNDSICVGKRIQIIYENFILGCTNFNKPITFAEGSCLETIQNGFLYDCTKFNQPLSFPSTLTSIEGDFMYNCSDFNQPLDISMVKDLSKCTKFLIDAITFNQPITLSNELNEIPQYFLLNCIKFNQNLTIPSSVTRIGNYFMCFCNDMTSTITINCPTTAYKDLKNGGYVGSTTEYNASCYVNGIKVNGENGANWVSSFYELSGTGGFYRKFVLV